MNYTKNYLTKHQDNNIQIKINMKQLEIKHLAPYLPYGVKYWNTRMCVDFSLTIQEESIPNTIDIEFVLNAQEYKPILYPLDYLTKEITHNGEIFVPILKIVEFLGIKYIGNTLNKNSVDLILDPKYHRPNTKTKESRKLRFWFSNHKGISFNADNMRILMYKDIYGAFQQLIEWRFDVFNLINDGLAIPVTEDINPYK